MVTKTQSFEFLRKQAIWQIYLPAPKKVIRPRFDVSAKDEVHQADLLFLPYDTIKVGRTNKTYKYALSLVDVGKRYKEAEPLTSKNSKEVAKAFEKIYSRSNRKAMNRNWSNQNSNPALKTKTGNK